MTGGAVEASTGLRHLQSTASLPKAKARTPIARPLFLLLTHVSTLRLVDRRLGTHPTSSHLCPRLSGATRELDLDRCRRHEGRVLRESPVSAGERTSSHGQGLAARTLLDEVGCLGCLHDAIGVLVRGDRGGVALDGVNEQMDQVLDCEPHGLEERP